VAAPVSRGELASSDVHAFVTQERARLGDATKKESLGDAKEAGPSIAGPQPTD
jgi:hypothetical protein